MRKLRRWSIVGLILLLSVTLVLNGCGRRSPRAGADGAEEQPVVGGTVIETTISDAKVLNPILVADTASSQVTNLVFDPLVAFDAEVRPYGRLAEDWQVSDDGLTWTFKLRQGVRWHDGEPFTARDVLFTFFAILHPEYTGVRASNYNLVKGVPAYMQELAALRQRLRDNEIDDAAFAAASSRLWHDLKAAGGIVQNGDYEVVITLEEPYAPFLAFAMSMGIIPEHILRGTEGAAMAEHPFNQRPVGTGRYKLGNWVRDARIELARNPDWFGDGPHIDNYVFQVIPDSQTAMVALETGEAHRSTITPEGVANFRHLAHVNLYEWMSFSYTYMGYNLRDPLFADRRMRQALTHAIDRESIVEHLLLGHGAVANTHGSPVRWDYNPDTPVREYNPDKAKALLAELGYTPGPDGKMQKDGRKLTFSIATNNGNKVREQAMIIIQQDLAKIGIDVTTELQEWSAFLDNIDNGNVQAYIIGWSLGIDPDAYQIFHSEGGFNVMHGFKNAQVDALIEQGRRTVDQDERQQIYRDMQQVLAEEQVYTWLFFMNTIQGLDHRIKGPIAGTPVGLEWNMHQWWMAVAP